MLKIDCIYEGLFPGCLFYFFSLYVCPYVSAIVLFFFSCVLSYHFFLFIYFWLLWVFTAMHGLSLVVVSGGCSALRWVGFPLQWFSWCRAWALGRAGFSTCSPRALEHWSSSCGARASLPRGMWHLPGPGIESMFPCTGRKILNHSWTASEVQF